ATPSSMPPLVEVPRTHSALSVPSTFQSQGSVESIPQDEEPRQEQLMGNMEGNPIQALESIFNTLQIQYQQENAAQALRIAGLERRWDLQTQDTTNIMQRIARITSRQEDGLNTFQERLTNVDCIQ